MSMNKTDHNRQTEPHTDYIAGRNAVMEALRSGRPIDSVWVAKGQRSGSIHVLVAQCRERDIPVKEVDSRKLDAVAGSHHQGVVAVAACKPYATLEDLLALAESRGEAPFFIVCDQLEDPHNIGAIIRTAEAAGAHGVIVPKRRSAPLTSAVYKASAGAVEYLPVARVSNLADTLQRLKQRNIWVYGLDMDGEPFSEVDYSGGVALVVGSEGQGLSRLVKQQCDRIVSLPMKGQIQSLNASVACGIVMYQVAVQRSQGKV